MDEKRQFLDLIKLNIEKYGYHVTTVNSMIEPRYAYTIGLSKLFNFELIFAGGIYYLKQDLLLIFDALFKELKRGKNLTNQRIAVDALGYFSLANVNSSWSNLMMLGVFDYYKTSHVKALQILPDEKHHTLDIPNMQKEFIASSEPIWQWLTRDWEYSVPNDSTVVTNINSLLGETITEVMRWENNEWEMFAGAGPDVQKKDIRVVSIGTILGIDKTLLPALDLKIGKGLWRDSVKSSWNSWG